MKIRRFTSFTSAMLIFSLLMGFSTPTNHIDYASPSKVANALGNVVELNQVDDSTNLLLLADDGTDISIANMKLLIEGFEKEGEFANLAISRSLQVHLTSVGHYEEIGSMKKALKHLNSFNLLVDLQRGNGMISDRASSILTSYTNSLIGKWEVIFDSDRVMDHIRHLSVDVGPRVAGSKEEKQAAEYLENQFLEYGYSVSTQEFDVRDSLKIQLKIIKNNEELSLGVANGSIETDEMGVTGNIYDAGLGQPEDFSDDINGSIALIQRGENSYWEKVQNATEAGAIGVIIYDNTESFTPLRPSLNNSSSIPVVGTTKENGESLLSQLSIENVKANLLVRTLRNQKSQNVIAVKKPANVENPEIVYVTSHYDSVPFSPGANDDGSGTAAVLELARIMKDFSTDKELRFVTFGAEEIGLVGSNYYVQQLSQAEISRSAINFQLEMLGTNWEPASKLMVNTVTGQPNLVWDYTKEAVEKLGIDEDLLVLFRRGSSDHVPFHNVGIEAACFNMGPGTSALEPYYHNPQDTIEHISPERLKFSGEIISSAIFDFLSQQVQNKISQETLMDDAS